MSLVSVSLALTEDNDLAASRNAKRRICWESHRKKGARATAQRLSKSKFCRSMLRPTGHRFVTMLSIASLMSLHGACNSCLCCRCILLIQHPHPGLAKMQPMVQCKKHIQAFHSISLQSTSEQFKSNESLQFQNALNELQRKIHVSPERFSGQTGSSDTSCPIQSSSDCFVPLLLLSLSRALDHTTVTIKEKARKQSRIWTVM